MKMGEMYSETVPPLNKNKKGNTPASPGRVKFFQSIEFSYKIKGVKKGRFLR